jgi:uncharacterized protein YjdB
VTFRLASGRSTNRRWWTLALASTALLASCDSPLASEIEEVTRLDINPTVLTIVVGGDATLTARVYGDGDELLPTAKVFWSTQDASVVTVTQEGLATAVAPGTTQIAASAGGLSRTIAVTVSQRPIQLIRISPPAGNVAVGSTLTLTGEALDGSGELLPNRLLEWSTTAPEIATVNATGVVTGVSTGQATISATGEGKTGSALITVMPSPVASITIQPNVGSVAAGGTILFSATPRDATGQPLTGRTLDWRSSNDAVATVSGSGLLTAISPGTVTVTVSAPGAGPGGTTPSASADVTVLIEPVASAVLVPSPATVQVGQNLPLTVNLFNAAGNPLSTAGRTITFTSSNTALATVNSSGIVTGVAVGNVTITATITTPAQPGVIQATAQVAVSNQPVASVVVSPSPATVHVGYSRVFSAVARNTAGQTLVGRTIIWTSSNQSIATVDQSGLVVGVSEGPVQIRATAEGVQGTATVIVDLVAVSSITLSPPAPSVAPGQTTQLTATPRDSAGTALVGPALGGRVTTWTSLNTAVVTVNTAGLVTGVAPGSAIVQATIGGTSGQVTVTVNALPVATQLAITTQPSSTAQNDIAFPIQPVVQLRDASGNTVATAGVVIQAAITAPGAGTLGGTTTATTNGSGAATFSNLKITGLTGARTLTFTSGTLTPATSGTVNVQAGAATQLVITTQPPATATSGQALSTAPVVQLRDISGNNVPQSGVQVTAAVTPGAGITLGGGTATTSASGAATFSAATLSGPAGSYTLTFSSGALTAATSSAIALGAGSGSRLSLTTQPSPTAQNGVPFPVQPVVQLRDASDNPVAQSGVVVTVAILSGGGTLGGTTTATTNAAGAASFSGLSITGTVGARTLLFGASGYTTVTSSAIAITAGAATALSVTTQPSATAQSGQAFASQPVIQLRDQSGNAVSQSGVAIAASVNGAGASLIGSASATTNATGVATFTGLGLSGTVGTYSLSFAASGLAGVTSSSIALAAGAAAQLTITTQPAGATSGSAFTTQPAIQLRDGGGNAVSQPGTTITASVASGPGGATLLGTGTATTNAAGLATFSGLGLSGTAGTYTIRFAATGLPNVTSGNVILGPGAPTQLVIQAQPAGAVNGIALATQPAIVVRDAQNNAVGAGVSVTASLNGGGAALFGSTAASTNSSGVATFSGLGLNGTVGNYSLTFAASGAPNVTSSGFALTAGAASKLSLSTPPTSTVASGTALATPPSVQLQDAGSNPVSQAGVNVSVTLTPAGATLTGATTVTTNASGVATFTGLGITGTAGNYTLQLSSAGFTGTSSGTISVTPGAAASLVMVTQPPATAASGSAFSTAPQVRLRDASGNNVSTAGVSITAAVTGGGATLAGSASAVTNASGVATFTGLGIDGGGTFTITFSSIGLTSAVSSAVVVSEPAARLGMVTPPSSTAQSGQAFATQPGIRLLSAIDNPVSQAGVTVTVSIGTGTGTLVGTASAVTNASGVATFTNLGIAGTAGPFTLAFSSTGLTGVSSGTINLTAGVAAKLLITQQPPSTVTPGATFTVVVRVADAQNNFVSTSGISVTAALNGTPGTLNGTTPVATIGSGTASFGDLSITGSSLGNSHSITFSATGLTSATSTTIDIVLFELVSGPEGVFRMTFDDGAPLVALVSGTKPVAAHTSGLRTFKGNSSRLADRATGRVAVSGRTFIALNQP